MLHLVAKNRAEEYWENNSGGIDISKHQYSVLPMEMGAESDKYKHVLIIREGDNYNFFHLHKPVYEIGRRKDADILVEDAAVSRYQATLIKEYDGENNTYFYKIIDGTLSGKRCKNGLIVNRKKYIFKILEHGDIIYFSPKTLARYFVIENNLEEKQKLLTESFGKIVSEKAIVDFSKNTLTLDENDTKEALEEEKRKSDSASKVDSFAELSPYPIIELNLQGEITYYNPAAIILFPDLRLQGKNHPLFDGIFLASQYTVHGNLLVREVRHGDRIFEQYTHYLPDLKVIRTYIFDFTERKRAEAQLKDSEAKYRAVVEQIKEGILVFTSDEYQIIEANAYASKILGRSVEELTDLRFLELVENVAVDLKYKLRVLRETGGCFREELKLKAKNNTAVDVELSVSLISYHNKLVYCSVFRDISERKKLEKELKYMAYHDSLTGVCKRNYFRENASKMLRNAKQTNSKMALMFLDVDYFKEINDNYGHDIGDLLLKSFAERLKGCLKKKDCIARWGGDEFVVLACDIPSLENLVMIVERIINNVRRPFVFDKITVKTSTSIGISLFPKHGEDLESLLKRADEALYVTKRNGRNGYTIAEYEGDW
ncbi:MAG: diguanylate cyclase [Geminocystis sp.]|nr:diguanylate cyclase [Geminocystis sp.]HIK36769.1 diguanylate cyclase [Geminocystis sp. M7585_C2015_104]MCS7146859.1 diguanylate cyclase [Geminocystis sp.]MCX8078879.1 diguanylate cyclase [Geminocystis sp.]MDW8115684.1 diguanylate cyclase [Geminocystis sp.]